MRALLSFYFLYRKCACVHIIHIASPFAYSGSYFDEFRNESVEVHLCIIVTISCPSLLLPLVCNCERVTGKHVYFSAQVDSAHLNCVNKAVNGRSPLHAFGCGFAEVKRMLDHFFPLDFDTSVYRSIAFHSLQQWKVLTTRHQHARTDTQQYGVVIFVLRQIQFSKPKHWVIQYAMSMCAIYF